MPALDFAPLIAELTRDGDVNSSAETLIADIWAKYQAALELGDPTAIIAQVQAITDGLKANNDKLSAAVAAVPA